MSMINTVYNVLAAHVRYCFDPFRLELINSRQDAKMKNIAINELPRTKPRGIKGEDIYLEIFDLDGHNLGTILFNMAPTLTSP